MAKKGLGLPAGEKFPILAAHLQAICVPRDTLHEVRDVAILCVGTICALRASEVRNLEVCDLLWEIDGLHTLTILLWKRTWIALGSRRSYSA